MKTIFEYLMNRFQINEARADDEYQKNYSDIDRDVFDKICRMDPKTQTLGDSIVNIGFGAKQLLLPKYQSGEVDFIDKGEQVTASLESYYPNIKNYPKFPQFRSVSDFLTFMDNPEAGASNLADTANESKITKIYNQYYSDIPRDLFDSIIKLDPETSDNKIGSIAKNLLLNCYKRGDTGWVDDLESVKTAIDRFIDNKDSYPAEKQDIMSYKSVAEFINYIPESPTIASLKGTDHEPVEGTDFIHICTSKNYDVFRPLTYRGSERIAHARGAQNVWCTAGGADGQHYGGTLDHSSSTSYWRNYSGDGPIFMFIHKSQPTDRTLNFNMSYKNGSVYECRDGNNGGPSSDGWAKKDNQNVNFKALLLNNPDLAIALSNTNCELANDPAVISVKTQAIYMDKPYVIDSKRALYTFMQTRDDLKSFLKQLIIKNIGDIPAELASGFISLQSVTIGEGISAIGMQSFKGCTSLKSLNHNLPEGLIVIEEEAFRSCTSLKGSIHLPNTLKEVRTYAFDGTHCQLKIDISRTSPIKFASADKIWVNAHVSAIKK